MNNRNQRSWRPTVEDCIVELLTDNSLGSIEFKRNELHRFESRLQEIFPNNSAIRATVNATLNDLVNNHHQIERLVTGKYRLIEGERLCLRVKLEKCERKLRAIAQILEPPLQTPRNATDKNSKPQSKKILWEKGIYAEFNWAETACTRKGSNSGGESG